MDDTHQQDEDYFNNTQQIKHEVDSLFDPGLVTLLTENYRSHEDIFYVPSELFYNALLSSSSSENNVIIYIYIE